MKIYAQLFTMVFMFYAWIEVDQNGKAAFISPRNAAPLTENLEQARSYRDKVEKYLLYQEFNTEQPRKDGILVGLEITAQLDEI